MNVPFVVPEDDTTPYPADFERVTAAIRAMGYALDVIEPGRAGGAIFDRIPFLVSFDTAGRLPANLALWGAGISAARAADAVFAAAAHRERGEDLPPGDTAATPAGTPRVYADFVVDTEAGLSNDQLRDAISSGISTGIAAMEYVKESASEALGWVNPDSDER